MKNETRFAVCYTIILLLGTVIACILVIKYNG